MTNSIKQRDTDTFEYEQLCILYDEEIQLEQDVNNKWKWIAACYSTHANTLKERHQHNIGVSNECR